MDVKSKQQQEQEEEEKIIQKIIQNIQETYVLCAGGLYKLQRTQSGYFGWKLDVTLSEYIYFYSTAITNTLWPLSKLQQVTTYINNLMDVRLNQSTLKKGKR